MGEIKVGEYVRTPNGIRKVKSTDNSDTYRLIIWFEDGGCIEQYLCRDGEWCSDDREKHSFNIIDLIEVGDIIKVKGIDDIREVINDKFYKHYNDTRAIVDDDGFSKRLAEFDIEQILAKEQYKANCYEVK